MRFRLKYFLVAILTVLILLIFSGVHFDIPREELEKKYATGKSQFLTLDDGSRVHYRDEGKKNKPVIFIEIAPYLYPEFGYNCEELIRFIQTLNYSFLDENIKEVKNIFDQINKIKDGGSKNFFLV